MPNPHHATSSFWLRCRRFTSKSSTNQPPAGSNSGHTLDSNDNGLQDEDDISKEGMIFTKHKSSVSSCIRSIKKHLMKILILSTSIIGEISLFFFFLLENLSLLTLDDEKDLKFIPE